MRANTRRVSGVIESWERAAKGILQTLNVKTDSHMNRRLISTFLWSEPDSWSGAFQARWVVRQEPLFPRCVIRIKRWMNVLGRARSSSQWSDHHLPRLA